MNTLPLDQLAATAMDSVRTIMEQTLEAQRDLVRGSIRATCEEEVIRAHQLITAGRLREGGEVLQMIKTLVAQMDKL